MKILKLCKKIETQDAIFKLNDIIASLDDLEVLMIKTRLLIEQEDLIRLNLPINLKYLIIKYEVCYLQRGNKTDILEFFDNFLNNVKLPFGCNIVLFVNNKYGSGMIYAPSFLMKKLKNKYDCVGVYFNNDTTVEGFKTEEQYKYLLKKITKNYKIEDYIISSSFEQVKEIKKLLLKL